MLCSADNLLPGCNAGKSVGRTLWRADSGQF